MKNIHLKKFHSGCTPSHLNCNSVRGWHSNLTPFRYYLESVKPLLLFLTETLNRYISFFAPIGWIHSLSGEIGVGILSNQLQPYRKSASMAI